MMSYLTQDEIAINSSMQHRVAQCYAAERPASPEPIDPDVWSYDHRRTWSAAPGWDTAWEYALNTHPADPNNPPPPGTDYDPGRDEAVITDGMILSQVQAMLAP